MTKHTNSRHLRTRVGLRRALVAVALIALNVVVPPVAAQSAKLATERGFPSLLLLVMEDGQGQPLSFGSGFVVRPGVVATNMLVVSGASRGWAKLVGHPKRFAVEGTVAIDEENDLALLAVSGIAAAPSLRLADSTKVAIGDEIFALGNPLGLEGTVSSGIVSGIRAVANTSLVQITAPISPGSSGGPVLDSRGDVIGVAVATFKGGQNLNFAIPAEKVARLVSVATSAVKPLQTTTTRRRAADPSKVIREKGTSGVVVARVDCFKPDPSNPFMKWECSFSVQNRLQSSVRDVRAILILWGRDGTAVDAREILIRGPIRPGLAVRSAAEDMETNVRRMAARLEARILDFRILE